MKEQCTCDETEVCKTCADNKDQLLDMLYQRTITINHFFKAKDLDDPMGYVCQDKDCMYCRNR